MYGVPKSKEFIELSRRAKMKPVLWIVDGEIKMRFESIQSAEQYFNSRAISDYLHKRVKHPTYLKENETLEFEHKKES